MYTATYQISSISRSSGANVRQKKMENNARPPKPMKKTGPERAQQVTRSTMKTERDAPSTCVGSNIRQNLARQESRIKDQMVV